MNLNVGPIEYPRNFTYQRTSVRDEDKQDLMVVKSRVTWSAKGKSAFEEVTSYLYYTNEVVGL